MTGAACALAHLPRRERRLVEALAFEVGVEAEAMLAAMAAEYLNLATEAPAALPLPPLEAVRRRTGKHKRRARA